MKVEGPALFHPHQYILRDVMDAPTHVFSLEEEMQTETECHCQYPHAHKNVFIYDGIWHHHFVMFLFMSDWIVDCCSGHRRWSQVMAMVVCCNV